MKTRTNIETEYTPCGLTEQGTWRPITHRRYKCKESAEYKLEEHISLRKEHPGCYESCKEYKIMKRTVVTTIGEWEDV